LPPGKIFFYLAPATNRSKKQKPVGFLPKIALKTKPACRFYRKAKEFMPIK